MTKSSSSRRFPITGRERRSSTMPTCLCCRDLRICAGVATISFWNRRALVRCSGFAIQRSRRPSPRCRRRSRSSGCDGRTAFPGSSFSPCCWIAGSCSRSTRRAAAACGRTRATTASCCGIFTISCSTRAARKAGTPIRWAASIPTQASSLRCRRCGRSGPGQKIDLRELSPAGFAADLACYQAPA